MRDKEIKPDTDSQSERSYTALSLKTSIKGQKKEENKWWKYAIIKILDVINSSNNKKIILTQYIMLCQCIYFLKYYLIINLPGKTYW